MHFSFFYLQKNRINLKQKCFVTLCKNLYSHIWSIYCIVYLFAIKKHLKEKIGFVSRTHIADDVSHEGGALSVCAP